MSSIIKGLNRESTLPAPSTEFRVNIPGYGSLSLEALKRHVKALSKEFNELIQTEEFIKAAHKTEQFYNALFALAKAMKAKTDSSIEEGKHRPKALFTNKPTKLDPETGERTEYDPSAYQPKGKEKGEEWSIRDTISKANVKAKKKATKDEKRFKTGTGFYNNYLGNRPFREEVEEGEVKPFVIPDEKIQGNYQNMNYRKNIDDKYAVFDHMFNAVILTTNNFKLAKKEAIEWADYDDLEISVINQKTNNTVFTVYGADGEQEYYEGIEETSSTGQGGGSAGIGGGSGLGIEKSPMEKVLEKPLGEHIGSPGGMGQAYRKFTPKSSGLKEDASKLHIGDRVQITGNVEFQGEKGDIENFDRLKAFVVVHLDNYGSRSFHSSDVSSYDEDEYQESAIMKGLNRE